MNKIIQTILPWDHDLISFLFIKFLRISEFVEEGLVPAEHCFPKKRIFFLKTSKTGSTTVAQIMARFSYNNQLNSLFGEDSSGNLLFTNQKRPFSAKDCFLGRDLPISPKFDSSFVHLRYDSDEIRKVMKPGYSSISILRNPEDNFVSSWMYYSKMLVPVRRLLRSFKMDLNNSIIFNLHLSFHLLSAKRNQTSRLRLKNS